MNTTQTGIAAPVPAFLGDILSEGDAITTHARARTWNQDAKNNWPTGESQGRLAEVNEAFAALFATGAGVFEYERETRFMTGKLRTVKAYKAAGRDEAKELELARDLMAVINTLPRTRATDSLHEKVYLYINSLEGGRA